MAPSPKIILVVEDDPTMRAIVIRVLERDGMMTLTAESGADALTRVREADVPPAVLIIDYTLPDMTGGELLTRLETSMGGDLPPTILLTGSVEEVEHVDAKRFDRVLGKPFSLGELEAHIAALVDS